ncbi:hypothetical protein GEO20_15915 [Rhodococcus erythropolis]|uniref:hypothetical protein n=1 Tax=Rhodococcus erythropolis TaxID=1833 RepID=UPI001292ABE5|nr:hypothetical protein [Rhodococcus erythropolis]MQP33454.1 hypothetical protein [Rhodococcus erythropolis]
MKMRTLARALPAALLIAVTGVTACTEAPTPSQAELDQAQLDCEQLAKEHYARNLFGRKIEPRLVTLDIYKVTQLNNGGVSVQGTAVGSSDDEERSFFCVASAVDGVLQPAELK